MKGKKEYLKAILSKYKQQKNNSSFYDFVPSPANIKTKLIQRINNENVLSSVDESIIRNFLSIDKNQDLILAIKKDSEIFKSIQYFLNEKTKSPIKIGVEDLAAFLIDFKPRPFTAYLNNKVDLNNQSEDINSTVKETKPENSNIPPEFIIKSNSKLLKVVAIIFVSIAFISGYWLLNDLFIKEKTQPVTVIYNTYNGNLNYYYTTKKDGEILLYDNLNSNNNRNLKPVTKEVILTYFKQQQIEVTNEDKQRWFKVNLDEENNNNTIKTAEVSTSNIKENFNKKNINTTKVTIKNNAVLDSQISTYFEQLYAKTNEDYVATGNVTYNFKQSSFSNQMIVCELVLTYKVQLYTSNTTFEVATITKTATGLSEIDAKNKAIKKLQFN